MSEDIRSIPVYLPKDKRDALKVIAKTKRQPMTKIIETEIDKLIKRETK